MKGTKGIEQQSSIPTRRSDRLRRPQIRFQDEPAINSSTTNLDNERNHVNTHLLQGTAQDNQVNSTSTGNTRGKPFEKPKTANTSSGTGPGTRQAPRTESGTKLDNRSSRHQQPPPLLPQEDKSIIGENIDLYSQQGDSLQEMITSLRNSTFSHSRESSSSKKSPQSSPKNQQRRSHKEFLNIRGVDQSFDSIKRQNGKAVRYHDSLGLETPSDEDRLDGNENSENSPKYKTKNEYAPTIDTNYTSKSPKQSNPLESTTPTSTAKPIIDRASRIMDQDELEQRMQALRASISAFSASTQHTIGNNPLPKSQRSQVTEKQPVPNKTQRPPNGRVPENMNEVKDQRNIRVSTISNDGIYQKQPSTTEDIAKHNHTTDRYTRTWSYSNTEESSDESESFSSHSYSRSGETTDEPDTRFGLQDIRVELQRMRKEMEHSKMESKQLQQWILDRSSHTHKPVYTKNPNQGMFVERPQLRQYHDSSYRSRPNVRSPMNNSRSKYQLWKHVSRPSMETRESSESSQNDEPFYSDSWRDIPAAIRVGGKRHGAISSSDISSGMESVYRDHNEVDQASAIPLKDNSEKPAISCTIQAKGKDKKSSIMKRTMLLFIQTLFWFGLFAILQVIIMSLLFRPSSLIKKTTIPAVNGGTPKMTTRFRGRDYVANQIGFYTYLNDGFGTDTLSYCHDLWEYPNDPRSHQIDLSAISVQTHRVVSNVSRFVDKFVEWVMVIMKNGWRWAVGWWKQVWNGDKDGDTLDWLYQ